MTTIDLWSNLRSSAAAAMWSSHPVFQGTAGYFSSDGAVKERNVEDALAAMDEAGIDISVLNGTAGTGAVYPSGNYTIDEVLELCGQHPERLRAALFVEGLGSISHICRKIEALAPQRHLVLIRVTPITVNEEINSPRLYPVYERCEGLGLPVSINVGVPGPKMRLRYQDPTLLDDVLIDFPDLAIIGAHMGHPWEPLLIRLMRKYDRLHLSNSGWLAKYLEPGVIRFMGSSAGCDRLMWASDAPLISPARALEEARKLPLSESAMNAFLGDNAARVLGLQVLSSDVTDAQALPR